MNKIIFIILVFSQMIFAQKNYLNEGNKLLSENKNAEAENIFREGIKSDNNNLIYKCQLALTLMNQKKNDEAETQIMQILSKDSLNVAALWYGGINNFTKQKPNFRKALVYFEKAFPLINKNSGQFFGVNYFIGSIYRNLLYTEGISYEETDRMLETYKEYLKLQPNAENANEINNFIIIIEKQRPPSNVKKWIIAQSEQKAEELIKEELKEKK